MTLSLATSDLLALLAAIPLAALGSNVVNIGLILGLALLFGALSARFSELRRDFVPAVPALALVLALDGILSRTDGALLNSAVWTGWRTCGIGSIGRCK